MRLPAGTKTGKTGSQARRCVRFMGRLNWIYEINRLAGLFKGDLVDVPPVQLGLDRPSTSHLSFAISPATYGDQTSAHLINKPMILRRERVHNHLSIMSLGSKGLIMSDG